MGGVGAGWGNPTFKVTWTIDYVVTWHLEKNYICTSLMPMVTKRDRVATYSGQPQLQSHVTFWLWSHVTHEKKTDICTFTIPMATKLARVVTYGGKAPSYVTFWSHGFMTNVKPYIFTSAITITTKVVNHQSSKLGNLIFKVRRPFDFVDTWQMKKTYLHFHNTHGYQIWQSGNLKWGHATQFTWTFYDVVTWQVKNLITAFPQYQ